MPRVAEVPGQNEMVGDFEFRKGGTGMLRFSDGMEFDTSGELRVECRSDGCYVVGEGMFIPVSDRKEGEEVIKEMAGKKHEG
jgi:hypothetical protein